MGMITIALAILGIVLLVTAPLLGRLIVRGRGDPLGITRVLQGLAVILLLAALFFRPYQPETAAFPPPPDAAVDQ